jgi:hypothetical protein
LLIYAGNNKGDVFIYKVKKIDEAFKNDPERPNMPAKLKLIDMIITGDEYVVRDVAQL